MKPDDGLYVPLPDTLAVPTVVPPEAQVVGGEDCGPNTVNVIDPVGLDPAVSVAEMLDEATVCPTVPDDGGDNDRLGLTARASIRNPCWWFELS